MVLSKNLDKDLQGAPSTLGDHLALDLLNTQVRSGDVLVEHFNTAEDILRWLARNGIELLAGNDTVDEQVLVAQMHALRAVARNAITQRKRGETIDVGELNAFLDAHLTSSKLLSNEGQYSLVQVPRGGVIASLLGPVAQVVAELLVDDNFDLVRQCEHPECVLWFYDRTKAHKRRWCSMAICGNRYKAAQFRKRNNETGPGAV